MTYKEFLYILIPEFICKRMCKSKGHIRNFYWIYGDEICPRCDLWLNKETYGWEEFK